ncbi:MAG TPA: SBBP repeat-containing protein [Bryobacteraceae bacterium]|nr:SBBP repeat-containing protein [Bryobacteraceae bacterium]
MRNLRTVAFVLCLASPRAIPGAAIHAHFGRLPVHFEANRGQTDPEVRYLARTTAFTLGITRSGASVALGAGSQVRMKLEGSARHPVIEPLGKLPGVSNYFLGPDPSRWLRNIPQYSAVKLNRIYKGIDLVFYGNARQLEYDFMVAPGIDPSVIRFQLEGASCIALDPGGDLILNTPGGELRHKRPIAYQGSGNRRISVEVRFRLRGRSVSFDVGRYNPREPLIIDPTLAYASYLGGSGGDYGHAIAVDSTGAAYIAGETYSLNFPGRSPDNEAIGRAFVTKINAAGTAIVYSTVFGGARTDAYSLGVDAEGAAYFSGLTFGGIPLRNSFQPQYGGNGDLFVAKLNPAGSDLVYSTYVGGSGIEGGQNRGTLRIDSTGAVYVAGQTRPPTSRSATLFNRTYVDPRMQWCSSSIRPEKISYFPPTLAAAAMRFSLCRWRWMRPTDQW